MFAYIKKASKTGRFFFEYSLLNSKFATQIGNVKDVIIIWLAKTGTGF